MAVHENIPASTIADLVREYEELPPDPPRLVASMPDMERWGILATPADIPFYIPPTLTRVGLPSESPPLAQLISAPAAVGKTTLAKHIHRQLAATGRTVLYVPLQHASIGDRYLAGLLSDTFPDRPKKELFEILFSSGIVLLFDGYDEVSMTTSQIEMNKKFIGEIIESFDSHKPAQRSGPSVVFLFRSVFAETGIFEAITPQATSYRVNFFDRVQRRNYLKQYLDAKGDEGRDLVPLVDEFLNGFEQRAEGAAPQEEAFFGHAIVLSAFGDFLINQGTQNAYVLAQNLKADGVDESSSVTILRGVIDTILNREAGKFPNLGTLQSLEGFSPFSEEFQQHLLSELAAGSPSGRAIADVNQLASTLGQKQIEAANGFATLSEAARHSATQDYLENLKRKIELHPFLDRVKDRLVFRNPIYREYFVARYASGHPEMPLKAVMGGDSGASYYLVLFLLSLVDDRNLSAHMTSLFFAVRLLAAACREDSYEIKFNCNSKEGVWLANVASDSLQVKPFKVSNDVVLYLELPAGASLQNFAVDGADVGVISISGPPGYQIDSPISLSQGVIAGVEVEFDAAAIAFDSVAIEARLLTFTDRTLEVGGLDTLTVIWREGHEWRASDYAKNRWGRDIANAAVNDAASLPLFQGKLKKIFLWFRKHGRAEYGVYRPRFHTCATNKGEDLVAKKVVDFLFKESILKDGSLIVLNQDELAKYDVYYGKQNELKFGPKFTVLFDRWKSYDA